jgi:UDP-N-acetylmuramoyl-L-alanyl-D-glutamate--2,6-diaminopimelate ligase
MDPSRTRFTARTPWGDFPVAMRLLGLHNVANALGAVAVAGGLGLPPDTIAAALAEMPCVPGRFEHVDEGQPFQVIVDYAHTEDGLRNVLHAARAICRGRVLTVFGCGGDRDRGKRPKMAATAGNLSDFCILTSDNPRTEDPRQILADAETGLREAGLAAPDYYRVIEDRAEAIGSALRMAGAGDLVMIAGKGHEDYQILGTRRIHFDDREVARNALRQMTHNPPSGG